MDDQVLFFFDQMKEAIPLYETFEKKLYAEIENIERKVQKTQISFYHRHLFACVSFAKVRKAKDRPPVYIVITFGTGRRIESPRIDVAAEPYPNRWTHHMLISRAEEIDGELMEWVREAAEFSAGK